MKTGDLKKGKVKSLSRVQLFATPWTAAHQAPLFMRFSRQEYWSGVPFQYMVTQDHNRATYYTKTAMSVMINMLLLESIRPGPHLFWQTSMCLVSAHGSSGLEQSSGLDDIASIISSHSHPRQPQILLLWWEQAARGG